MNRTTSRTRWRLALTSTLSLSLVPVVVGQEVVPASFLPPAKPASLLKKQGATQPPQPFGAGNEQPTPSPSESNVGGGAPDLLSGFGSRRAQEAQTASPGTNAVSGSSESGSNKASTDVGDFLAKSEEALGFEVQRRSPIISDPSIRGYRAGQITTYLDGGWAYPARIDLDTIVSKIDSANIRDVVVIKGPYSVRYGSGFSFLDIATNAPPRYDCAFENHGQIISGFKSNGQQLRERGDFFGGNSDFGYRLGYTLGVGNDYTVPQDIIGPPPFNTNFGNLVPASYNSQSIDYAFGFDLSENSTLSLYGMNLVQRNVELPGFPFDFRRLQSDNFTVRHELRNQTWFDKLTTDAWYNYTQFTGDNGIQANPNYNPGPGSEGGGSPIIPLPGYSKRGWTYNPLTTREFGDEGFFPGLAIAVSGQTMTTGVRQMMSWGNTKDIEFMVGWDLRYLSQRNDEYDFFTANTGAGGLGFTNYPVPRSHNLARGIFSDTTMNVSDRFVVKMGGRLDVVNTDIDSFDQGLTENQIRQALDNQAFNREFVLWNGYISSEYKLSKELSVLSGLGTGQRPGTLTELYGISPYSAQFQRSLHFFRGNPGLAPEQLFQADAGFRTDGEWFRAGVTGYVSWVRNYITVQPDYNSLPPEVYQLTGQDPPPAPGTIRDSMGFTFVNTNLAFLTGFEAYTEINVLPWLTGYALSSYVQGTDLTRGDRVTPEQIAGGLFPSVPDNEPLPGIVPLDNRVGIRIHETSDQPRWTVDLGARIVVSQNRVATSLGEIPTPGFTVYNVRGNWRINDTWAISGGIENVFDRFYREHLDIITGAGVYQPGRNFYAVVEMRF
ncbi:MAG: TonB-dependent receptor [Gemmatales bacterium]